MTTGRTRAWCRRRGWRVLVAVLSISTALLPGTGPSVASAGPFAGTLDSTFDGDGRVTTSFVNGGPLKSGAESVVIQQDGRIVAAGYVTQGIDGTDEFALARYLADGQLDPMFGMGGKVITSMSPSQDRASAIATQPDGKIVVVGFAMNVNPSHADFAVVRYLADGTLDPSFSSDGKLTTAVSANDYDHARAIAVQQDGKIVVAGDSGLGATQRFALARYLPDGQLDPTFGNAGIVTTALGGHAFIEAVAIQTDGKIVVAGGANTEIALARYLENGQLDPQFGNGGTTITPKAGNHSATSMALQNNGMIVVGVSPWGYEGFIVMRYQGNGALDQTFGQAGIATTPIVPSQYATARAVSAHVKGTIVVVGTAHTGSTGAIGLARFLPTGQLDKSFGKGGVVATLFKGASAGAVALAIDKSKRIVVAGSASASNDTRDFALARYLD